VGAERGYGFCKRKGALWETGKPFLLTGGERQTPKEGRKEGRLLANGAGREAVAIPPTIGGSVIDEKKSNRSKKDVGWGKRGGGRRKEGRREWREKGLFWILKGAESVPKKERDQKKRNPQKRKNAESKKRKRRRETASLLQGSYYEEWDEQSGKIIGKQGGFDAQRKKVHCILGRVCARSG